jgi:hypothetical protein
MLKHPNYTFSIPDKRLYTLFKGITITPHFVWASSVSSHGRAYFTCGASCLSFVRHPLHVQCAYVSRCFSDRAKGTARAALSVPKRSTTPPRPCWVSRVSRVTRSRPASEPTRHMVFPTYQHLWCRMHVTFGAAAGRSSTCETTLTLVKQC